MAKKRLNQADRALLLNLAKDKVTTFFQKRIDTNLKNHDKLISKALLEFHKQFPAEEMAILKKYGAAHNSSRIYVSYVDIKIGIKQDKEIQAYEPVLQPCSYSNASLKLPLHGEIQKGFEDYRMERDNIEKEIETKLKDYRALINNTNNFEDVIAVWPEAAELSHSIKNASGTSLIVLSEETINNIQADMKLRKVK